MASSATRVRPREEKFHATAHEVFLRLKNKKEKTQLDATQQEIEITETFKRPKLWSYYFGFLQILGDWVLDVGIACLHFYQGRPVTGALTLGFVFIGGFFVTLNLHVLMKRNGHKEFKAELRKMSPILLCLIYIPSFLPLFSAILQIRIAHKLRRINVQTEREEAMRLQRILKITEQHAATDVLYESSYEAYGQAILQMLSIVERHDFEKIIDYLPLVGVFFSWLEVTMPPIKLGVTLLSFTLLIAASRKQFATPGLEVEDLYEMDIWLIVATLGSILFLAIFSEIPGIVTFRLELRSKVDHKAYRWIKLWELLSNVIALVIPIGAFTFWTLRMYFDDEICTLHFYIIGGMSVLLFFIAIVGFFVHSNLPWLGQFSTDILLLLYIGFYSHFKKTEFQNIDFHYDSQHPVDANDNLPPKSISIQVEKNNNK